MTTKAPVASAPDSQKFVRHEELKARLQTMYGGMAREYEPCNCGAPYAPHGTCPVKPYMQMVDSFSLGVRVAEQKIAQYEAELRDKHPYVPTPIHPMMVLQSGMGGPENMRAGQRSAAARLELFRQIGLALAEKRQHEEHLAFWREHVRPISDAYLNEIASYFAEKTRLREELLLEENICVVPW